MKPKFELTEQDYRYLFENASDAMWVQDMQGNIVDLNRACEKLTGFTRDELLGKNTRDFLTGEGLKLAKEMSFGRVLSGKECAQYGFANHCFPADKLDEETTKIARKIATIHPELLSLTKRQVCRNFDIRGFRVSVEYGGEFDSLSHKGQEYGYQRTIREMGLSASLKKLNEPWGGV